MGADQHVLTEIKHDGGQWQLWHRRPTVRYSNLPGIDNEIDCLSGRDYVWFGILAGVRTNYKGIVANRGVPADASSCVHEWNALNRFHSMTWANIAELQQAANTYVSETFSRSYSNARPSIYGKSKIYRDEDDNKVDYLKYNNLSIEPILREYDDLCAEAEFLGLKKPEIRLIIGFDS